MPTWHAVRVISTSSSPIGRSPTPIGGVPHWRVVPGIAVTPSAPSSRSVLGLFSFSYLLLWNSLLDLNVTILILNETCNENNHRYMHIIGVWFQWHCVQNKDENCQSCIHSELMTHDTRGDAVYTGHCRHGYHEGLLVINTQCYKCNTWVKSFPQV